MCKLGYLITKNKLFKMMCEEPNIQINDLEKIKIPTIILAGEKDVIKLKHTKLIANKIKNSKLEIIKNENHGSYIIHTDKIFNIIKKYI